MAFQTISTKWASEQDVHTKFTQRESKGIFKQYFLSYKCLKQRRSNQPYPRKPSFIVVSGETRIKGTNCGICFDCLPNRKKTASSFYFNSQYPVHQLLKSVAIRSTIDCEQEQQLRLSYWVQSSWNVFIREFKISESFPNTFLEIDEIRVWFCIELWLYLKFLDNEYTVQAPRKIYLPD